MRPGNRSLPRTGHAHVTAYSLIAQAMCFDFLRCNALELGQTPELPHHIRIRPRCAWTCYLFAVTPSSFPKLAASLTLGNFSRLSGSTLPLWP